MAKSKKISPEDQDVIYEPLLDTESSVMFFLAEASITTCSFFNDVDHANSVAFLKERLLDVCRENPWLAARLVKNKEIHKNVSLEIPQSISEKDIDAILSIQDTTIATLNSSTPFPDLCTAISKSTSMVPIGYKLIGKDQRVSKFTFVQNDQGECLLIFSLTHAVADGYTYYKIMGMLTENTDITPLSFQRKFESLPKMKEAMGTKEYELASSTGMAVGMLSSMVCRSQPYFHARYVDEEKVQKIKDEVTRRTASNSSSSSFACSTNDILTSTFAQAVPADILFMAINWRQRIPLVDNDDSGNYSTAILYDRASTEKPESVRASLSNGIPFRGVSGEAWPRGLKLWFRTQYALITNWTFKSFQADMTLRTKLNEPSPSMSLHLPVYSPSAVVFPTAIVFRPCKEKLAVLYMGNARDLQMRNLEASGAPLGKYVNEQMFS